MNRHERRALAKNSPGPRLAGEVDKILDRIMNGSVNLADVRALEIIEAELLTMLGGYRVDEALVEVQRAITESRNMVIVR